LLSISPKDGSECSESQFVVLEGNQYVKFEGPWLKSAVDTLPEKFDVKAIAVNECSEKPVLFDFLIETSVDDSDYWEE